MRNVISHIFVLSNGCQLTDRPEHSIVLPVVDDALAVEGPTSGNASSSSTSAVFMSTRSEPYDSSPTSSSEAVYTTLGVPSESRAV